MKKVPFLFFPLLLLSGCATHKGPKVVSAHLYQPAVAGHIQTEPYDRPRQQAGEVMDPQAITFAQVPKRILFLPGQETTTSRISPSQEVAYNLVPVQQIPEIQSQQKPTIIVPPSSPGAELSGTKDISIYDEASKSTIDGRIRILDIRSNNQESLAQSQLAPGETAKFIKPYGWVGWKAKPTTPNPSTPSATPPSSELPSLPNTSTEKSPTPPKLENPNSETGSTTPKASPTPKKPSGKLGSMLPPLP